MLGDFDVSTYTASPLLTTFFLWYTCVVNIVLLNALISIISDTYEKVLDSSTQRKLFRRAELLVEIEMLMDRSDYDNTDYFPAYLHVLQRIDRHGQPAVTEWNGRLQALRKEITRVSYHLVTRDHKGKLPPSHKRSQG